MLLQTSGLFLRYWARSIDCHRISVKTQLLQIQQRLRSDRQAFSRVGLPIQSIHLEFVDFSQLCYAVSMQVEYSEILEF